MYTFTLSCEETIHSRGRACLHPSTEPSMRMPQEKEGTIFVCVCDRFHDSGEISLTQCMVDDEEIGQGTMRQDVGDGVALLYAE